MKTTALLVLLALGVVSASGCHWLHHRRRLFQELRFPIDSSMPRLRILIEAGAAAFQFTELHRIIGRAIVPENFSFMFVGDGQLEEVIHRFGIFGIAMRIIRRKNQPAAAELVD